MKSKHDRTTEDLSSPAYIGSRIEGIRFGKENRSHILYAKLLDKDGKLLISATLDYIVSALKIRLPK